MQIEFYPDENRQIIIDYLVEQKTVNPTADNNWTFTKFPEGVKVVFEAAKNAEKVLTEDSQIKYLGEGKYTFK